MSAVNAFVFAVATMSFICSDHAAYADRQPDRYCHAAARQIARIAYYNNVGTTMSTTIVSACA